MTDRGILKNLTISCSLTTTFSPFPPVSCLETIDYLWRLQNITAFSKKAERTDEKLAEMKEFNEKDWVSRRAEW